MNLNNIINSKLKLLHGVEPQVSDSKIIMDYITAEKEFYNNLQFLLYKALDKEYPCHGISMSYDMLANYDFDIVVTPK